MTTRRQNTILVAGVALLAVIFSSQIAFSDSFAGDRDWSLSSSTSQSRSDEVDNDSTTQQLLAISNSFVREADLSRQTGSQNHIDLGQALASVSGFSGDSFVSKQDISRLTHCRIDASAETVGFMVCRIDTGQDILR